MACDFGKLTLQPETKAKMSNFIKTVKTGVSCRLTHR